MARSRAGGGGADGAGARAGGTGGSSPRVRRRSAFNGRAPCIACSNARRSSSPPPGPPSFPGPSPFPPGNRSASFFLVMLGYRARRDGSGAIWRPTGGTRQLSWGYADKPRTATSAFTYPHHEGKSTLPARRGVMKGPNQNPNTAGMWAPTPTPPNPAGGQTPGGPLFREAHRGTTPPCGQRPPPRPPRDRPGPRRPVKRRPSRAAARVRRTSPTVRGCSGRASSSASTRSSARSDRAAWGRSTRRFTPASASRWR